MELNSLAKIFFFVSPQKSLDILANGFEVQVCHGKSNTVSRSLFFILDDQLIVSEHKEVFIPFQDLPFIFLFNVIDIMIAHWHHEASTFPSCFCTVWVFTEPTNSVPIQKPYQNNDVVLIFNFCLPFIKASIFISFKQCSSVPYSFGNHIFYRVNDEVFLFKVQLVEQEWFGHEKQFWFMQGDLGEGCFIVGHCYWLSGL